MARAVELDLKGMKLRDLLRLTGYVLRELERRLVQETGIFDKYAVYSRGCSVSITWVRNKVGRRYYYPYLKCKRGKPKSIYLGDKIVLQRMISEYKSLQGIIKHRQTIIRLLEKTLATLNDIEMIISAAEEMREAEKEALQDQALLEKSKAKGRYLRRG